MPTATLSNKGKITLPKEDGDIVVRPVSLDVTELKGLLERPRKRPVSIASMNAAIVRQHSKKR